MAEGQTFTSIVWFKVKPGMNTEFESAFLDAGMLTRPAVIDGFIEVHLHHSLMHDDEYYVLGSWTSEESYAAWQSMASEGAPKGAMRRLSDVLVEFKPNVLMSRIA